MKALSFEGSGFEYFKIWIVNILLTLITLGLYYPWAKVRNHRYFYANTSLEGKSFEYHATGKQLFIGYLIAMGLFIAYVVIQQISPIGSFVVMGIFLLAFPWIIWRSLKFNLRMTSFSNVRFSFEGDLGKAYIIYMLLPLAFFLTLIGAPVILLVVVPMLAGDSMSTGTGLLIGFSYVMVFALAFFLFAYMKKRTTHFVVNGGRFGQGQFSTRVETAEFAKIIFKTIGLGILTLIILMLVIAVIVTAAIGLSGSLEMLQNVNDPTKIQNSLGAGLFMIIGSVYIGMIFIGFFIGAYAYTRQRSYLFANSTLDSHISFCSTLKARSLAWVMISNLLVIVLTLGLALPWASVRMTRLVLENTQVKSEKGFDQYVTEQQQEQSSLGEQIGDAFDVDLGVGI